MPIFLDHAATTPIRQVARHALDQALDALGNPSSVHSHGQITREILEQARDQVASAIESQRAEIIFLSGGTEANNQAIKGMWWGRRKGTSIIVSAATEHKALLDPLDWVVRHEGAELVEVPVSKTGVLDLEFLETFLQQRGSEVALISLMWVNNETGVITDIKRVCQLAESYQIPVHSDAAQAVGNIPVSFAQSGLTAMSISGHKLGAPIGVGALVVGRNSKPESLIHGGGQERGLRSGTMNYPYASALAAAVTEAVSEMNYRQQRLEEIRNWLESKVKEIVPEVILTAAGTNRVSHNAHLIFPGVNNDSLLFLLDQAGVSVSAGSACQAGVLGPSHVLKAMGFSDEDASSCLRVTLGHTSTRSDAEAFAEALAKAYPMALSASRTTH